MTRQEKIEYILDSLRRQGRTYARAALEAKSDRFIDKMYLVESDIEEKQLDEAISTIF